MSRLARPLASLACLAALATTPGCSQGGSPPPVPAPPAPVAAAGALEDVRLLRRALESVHAGYDRYAPPDTLAAAWARLEAAAARGPDQLAFYGEVSRLLAVLRCDHTKAELPAALEAWQRANPWHLPFRFRLFGRRMFVDVAPPATGLARGDEVLALDGRPVEAVLDTLASLVAIDGRTEHVRLAKLEGDGDLYGTDLDTYWPAVFGRQDSVTVRVRPRGAEGATERRLARIGFDAWKALLPGTYRLDFGTATRLTFPDDTTALLRIPTFVNYRRPVDARDFIGALFDSIAARGARHLVLDIGGGGSTEPVDELMRRLMPAPFVVTREARVRQRRVPADLLPHVTTWNRDALDPPDRALVAADSGWWRLTEYERARRKPLVPYDDRYRGRVTVLTGPGNSSGATMLIARLHAAGRVRLVGDSTGGSAEGPTAGTLLTLTLPASGIRVRVPLVRSWVDVPSFAPGLGVAPDVLARATVDDWLAGRDPALDSAIDRR
jgi:hypothetical protein